jgi:hypothetical protein
MSVETIRQQFFSRLNLPPDLLSRALEVTEKKLSAKIIKFGFHRGEVVSKTLVEDHATQLAAADQIYSIAGVYAREKDSVRRTPTVAFEVDSKTGVVRFIVGNNDLRKGGAYEAIDGLNPVSLASGDGGSESQLPLFTTSGENGTLSSSSEEPEFAMETVPFTAVNPPQTPVLRIPSPTGKPPTSKVKPTRPKDIPEYVWNILNS